MSTTKFPSNGLTLVSLFAGCGGSSLGYEAAGYDVRLAVDNDAEAAETYRRNFPGTPFYKGDVEGLGGGEALRLARLAPGELDVLDGSPPCQGFSVLGKRRFLDRRNGLFKEYVRLLEAFQPRAFIMENVSGLRKGKMVLLFAYMTRALKAVGYRVSCRELNAWWYAIPQRRLRLIWVGLRADLTVNPSHPAPTVRRPLTVAQAWLGIPAYDPLQAAFKLPHARSKTGRALAVTGPGRILTGFTLARRLALDLPAWTVATGGSVLGYPGSSWFSHPLEPRGITVREAARLQAFPDCFLFPADFKQAARLIGNAVPPPMAEAVGRHVAALLKGGAP